MPGNYKEALKLLVSAPLRGRPRADMLKSNLTLASMSNEKPNFAWTPSGDGKPYWNGLGGMKENLQLLGYSDEKLRCLNVVHVAGTKGKGSTCAFIHSFLKAHGARTGFPRKVGLYTSPHLVHNRERIRINMIPISEQLFTKYFFEVWEKIFDHASRSAYRMPGYLQLLMLLSIHVFAQEGVDAAIYETHSGGEFCSTNFCKPLVTGITTLGLDHTDILGPSIENVAWHKGGIFKPGTPAFSSPQAPAAIQVLQKRAAERGVQFQVIEEDLSLPAKALALEPEVQRVNAFLALAITKEFLKLEAPEGTNSLSSQDVAHGLERYTWPGRFHRVNDGPPSHWFANASLVTPRLGSSLVRVLIFSHHSFRDGVALVKCVVESLEKGGVRIQHVIFTTSGEEGREAASKDRVSLSSLSSDESSNDLETYTQVWRKADPDARISRQPSISKAMEFAKALGDEVDEMHVFVTGTTRLVGPVLDILERGSL